MTDALFALKEAIRHGKPEEDPGSSPMPDRPNFDYAVARLLTSWSHAGRLNADQTILLRQALRYLETPVVINEKPPDDPEILRYLAKAGIDWTHTGTVRAKPYNPSWLTDSFRCDDPPSERNLDESFQGEAYLNSLGYLNWRSPAQKEAAWFTLHAPPGSTQIVVLPTGAGKSLCFQLLPRFTDGLTVVVVPTIALAIDQQMNSRRLFAAYSDVNPVYFAADDDAATTLDLVANKKTRLLFTSPEACVSGRLRKILDEFAGTGAGPGWFTNLVVDEAHLIETWGTHFRVEFQFLSSAKKRWRRSSGGTLRTFLFSATMTERCRNMLGAMFSDGEPCPEFVCQRLRPEIRYFSRTFKTKSERDQAVVESIWNLPRPAILYVTEKKEAEEFLTTFRDEGMTRIATFHGDTKRGDRREILNRWKNHDIDLIIATSAFGVGVDKADVRVVVHACHPENLDRYYQEVGRGGRDGWSSLSFLLTYPGDRKTAEQITVRLMTPEMIQERWKSLIRHYEYIDYLCYKLPVAARRTGLVGTRTYKENIRWNKRLLLQLSRAKQLELLDLEWRNPESPDEDPEEWVSVKLRFQPETQALAELIEDQRNEEADYFRMGLEKLDEVLDGTSCSGRIIARLYGIPSGQRACPGCPRCRRDGFSPLDCEPLSFTEASSSGVKTESIWVEDAPIYAGASSRSLFVDMLSRCVSYKGLRQFYCPLDHYQTVLECFAEAYPRNRRELYRLDPLGPETRVGVSATLPIVLLHFATVDPTAVELGRRHPCVHLFCGHHDIHGRDVAVTENLRRWTYPAWISSTSENSLPCSLTIP